MTLNRYPSPQRGDVLFTNSNDIESFFSVIVQTRVDKEAKNTKSAFSHVALAIDNTLALEAVPRECNKNSKFPWSKVELRSGIRIIPIADILANVINNSEALTVLRGSSPSNLINKILDRNSTEILNLIGSQYSIESIISEFDLKISIKTLTKFEWTSSANDLATNMGLTDELKQKIEESVGICLDEYAIKSYYCSELVVDLLKKCYLLDASKSATLITPSGLYNLLFRNNWKDVTKIDYSNNSIKELLNDNLENSRINSSYYACLSQQGISQNIIAYGIFNDVIGGFTDSFKTKLNNHFIS